MLGTLTSILSLHGQTLWGVVSNYVVPRSPNSLRCCSAKVLELVADTKNPETGFVPLHHLHIRHPDQSSKHERAGFRVQNHSKLLQNTGWLIDTERGHQRRGSRRPNATIACSSAPFARIARIIVLRCRGMLMLAPACHYPMMSYSLLF